MLNFELLIFDNFYFLFQILMNKELFDPYSYPEGKKQKALAEMSSKEQVEALIPELSDIRYREMMRLFNDKYHKKPYTEGLVMTENHARIFLYFRAFSFLSEKEFYDLIHECEEHHPNLKGAIYLREFKNKRFISIEPLFPNGLEKEVAKKLADKIRDRLANQ